MKEFSDRLASSKRRTKTPNRAARWIVLAVALFILRAPLIDARPDGTVITSGARSYSARDQVGGGFDCGYDPRGAEDEVHAHRLNALRSKARLSAQVAADSITETSFGPRAEIVDDIAVIEDDGTIVVPPNNFNLKKRSLLFTPDGAGYRIERADFSFETDRGSKLRDFLGADGQPGTGNNGYREMILSGAPFPFYGIAYDTIYIGTNGYMTFGKGDTSARVSASSLGSEMPRIAPLWADLDVSDSGNIYYNRLEGRHLITWDAAPEVVYGGKSTFQTVLYDDGRIAFVYKKAKARSSLAGISPGSSGLDPQPVDFTDPPEAAVSGPFFETFSKEKRLDLPALTRALYRSQPDEFDSIFIWTDFSYDNGLGVAHSFNVRNDIGGIGLRIFDRGSQYGSPSRLATVITMGDEGDWPSDPQALTAGLNTAVCIVCHELGHRWLAYVRFEAGHTTKDDLLGRDNSHWSFLADTRTNSQGTFSSLMEGNAWRDGGSGTFTTIESAVNHFSPLDQYLMGLRSADEVGEISYLVTDEQFTQLIREKSPVSGLSVTAVRKTATVSQIVANEGPRLPDVSTSPKELRVAFVLLTQQGAGASVMQKIARYRDALVHYFSAATGRRASLDASLVR
ncbi:MAG: hypothetical protein AABO41_19855 [Acidobacteriota bacterium]